MPFSLHINNWIGGLNVFSMYSNNLYASPKFGSIIYYYTDNDFCPKYKITFSKNSFPENENIYEHILDTNFSYVVKRNYYMSEKYLIFDYIYDENRHYCFYDLTTGELSNGIINNDLIENFRFFPRWGNSNYLIEEVDAEYVIDNFSSLRNHNEQLRDIKVDDKPVIVLYTLRSD
jgi:hypothetical protein